MKLRQMLALVLVAVALFGLVDTTLAQTTGKAPKVSGRFVATGSGTAPTLSACGTATVSGTDTAGKITHTVGGTGCVVTFNEAFTTAPACVAAMSTDVATGGWVRSVATTTADMTITYEVESADNGTYTYVCIGR